MEIGFFEIAPLKRSFGARKIIVLLHGWGANKERLRLLGEKLALHGWYVVGIDLPGFGQTPARQAMNVSDYAHFVNKFITNQTISIWFSFV